MTKTITRKIGEGVAWISGTSVLVKFIGIAYTITVLSNVSVYEYGLIELAMSIIPLLGIFNLAGIQPVVVADLVSHKTEAEYSKMRYLFSAFVSLKVILGFVAFTLLNLAVILSADSFSENILLLVQILSLVFLAGPIRASVMLLFTVFHRFGTLAQIQLLEEMCKLLLVYLFLVPLNLGPVGVVLAFVITDFLITLFYLPAVMRVAKIEFAGVPWSRGFLDPFFVVRHHAKWSVFQSTLHQFGQNIRPWIIQLFLGTQAVGIYAVATGLYQHVQSVVPIARVVSPIVPELKTEHVRLSRLLNSAVKYQVVFMATAVIGAMIVLPYLIEWFFPSYKEAFPLFLLLSFVLLPDSFSRIYESAFHAFQLQKNLFYANVIKMVMVATVLPVSLLLFGLEGVAVEFFLTLTVYAVTRYGVLKRKIPEYKFIFRDLFRYTETDRLLVRKIHNFLINQWRLRFQKT